MDSYWLEWGNEASQIGLAEKLQTHRAISTPTYGQDNAAKYQILFDICKTILWMLGFESSLCNQKGA